MAQSAECGPGFDEALQGGQPVTALVPVGGRERHLRIFHNHSPLSLA